MFTRAHGELAAPGAPALPAPRSPPGRDRQHPPPPPPRTPARRHTGDDTTPHGASPAAAGARRRGCPLPAGLAASTHRLPRCPAGDRTAPEITLFTTILKPTDPLPPAASDSRPPLPGPATALTRTEGEIFPPQVSRSFSLKAPAQPLQTPTSRAKTAQGGHFLEPHLQTSQPRRVRTSNYSEGV